MLKQQLDKDLKAALLGGEKDRATVIRGLKSAILYAELAAGARDKGLEDDAIIVILAKESKKRQESADLYEKGGSGDRAATELEEKAIIDAYLPKQMNDDELKAIISEVITETNAEGMEAMGRVIGAVKSRTSGQADGARIAQFVKERLVV